MTRPEHVLKFCPKCGFHHFQFDGDRSFTCKSCRFQLYINSSAAVAAVIINSNRELLLTVRAHDPNKGFLDLPGGFVDPMESAEVALIREIKEELALQVDELSYLCSFPNEYVFSGYSVFTTDLAFMTQIHDFTPIHADDDITGFDFFSYRDIDFSRISSESIASIIHFAYDRHYIKWKPGSLSRLSWTDSHC